VSGAKKRLDVLLVERGLAESRSQAQALVLAGLVRGYEKPGEQVRDDVVLDVEAPPRFVSRGGEKLQNALDAFDVRVAGPRLRRRRRLDGRVHRLPAPGRREPRRRHRRRLRAAPSAPAADPRVTVLERTNARSLTELPFAPDLVVCDVSFISVTKALPPVLRLAVPGWEALVLVKPQFEAGRKESRRASSAIPTCNERCSKPSSKLHASGVRQRSAS
jgi:23S rRNA (cytidine1920-2'-O)/16S rRNA (cytidine1409-2'-O)-methyltransferase